MPNLGVWEILLVLLVLLLVFGPKRLPGMGRSLGRGMREFKESVTDTGREIREAAVVTPDAPAREEQMRAQQFASFDAVPRHITARIWATSSLSVK